MDARKQSQELLVNGWALGQGCLAVNERVWFEDHDGVRVVCVRNTPFYTYDLHDRVQHLFCACQLIEARLATQCDTARAFGISARTLQRARRKVRDGGIAGLVPQKKGPERRHQGGGAVGRRIVKLWKKGARRLEIAARLGVSEGTVRNILKEQGLYPQPQTPQPSLPFAGSHDEGCPQDPEQDEAESCAGTEANRGSGVAVEATSIAYASPLAQFAARLGLIEEAPVEFAPARDVPLAVKRKDGRQTQILCSRYDIDPAELAYRMFGRWKQENWFKYMSEQFALDVLVDHATEPDDPDRLVINPTWRGLDRELKAARAELQKAEAAYGRVSLSNASSAERERCAAEVEQARDRYDRLCQQRRDTPRQVRLGDVTDGDPVKLTYERKLLTDTIKMCAYDVETQLTEMLAGVLRRQDFEGRAVIRELFKTPADLSLSNGQLHVHFSQLSAPRYTEALMALCEQLNARDLPVPETSLTLRFHVNPRPENGQN